jgi:hypothetical protein
MVAYVPPKQAGKYKAVASGAITNGKPVLVNADGTVGQIGAIVQALGSEVVFESANAQYVSATFDSSNNKVVIAYRDGGNSNYGTAIVATIDSSDNSVSYGSPTVFNSANSLFNSATFDSSNNKVVIAYQNGGDSSHGYAIVGTVSGTSISFGTHTEFEGAVANYINSTFDSSNNKVVIAYSDSGNSSRPTAVVGTVSSTSISFGTPVQVNDSRGEYLQGITFDSSNNKVIIPFPDASESDYGYVCVGTVSGTSISFGTPVVFNSAQIYFPSAAFDTNSNKVVISYRDGSTNQGEAIVGTVSGTGISFGTAVVFETGSMNYTNTVFDSSVNKINIFFDDIGDSSKGKLVAGTVSNTAISFGSATVFNAADTDYISSAFDSNVNRVLIAYQDVGNSSYGTGIVLKNGASTNVTSENYIGLATGGTYPTAAEVTIDVVGTVNKDQTGLTAGQTYFVQNDGTIGTTADDPSVVAGTAISATELIVKG